MITLFKPIKTTSEKLVSIQKKAGQLIFVTDTYRLYIDTSSTERILVSADSFIDVSCTDGKTLTFTKADGSVASAAIAVDSSLSATSTNAVQNKTVYEKIQDVLQLISNNTSAINTVDGKVTETNKTLSAEQAKISTAQTDISNLQSDVSTLQTTVGDLDAEDKRLAGLIKTNSDNIAIHNGAIADLGTSVDNLGKEDIRLAGLIDNNAKTISNNTGRIATNEGNITTLQGKMSTAEGKISNLETADTDIKGRLDTIEGNLTGVTSVKTYVDNAQSSAISTAQTKAQELANAAESNAKEYTDNLETDINGQISDINNTLDNHEDRIANVEVFLDAAEHGDKVVDTLKEIQEYIGTHAGAAAAMTQSIQGNTQAIEALSNSTNEKVGKLEATDAEFDTAIGELETAVEARATKEEFGALSVTVETAVNDIVDLTNRMSAVEGVASNNTNSINSLSGDINTLQETVASQGNTLNTINNDYLKNADKTDLQNQINTLNNNTIKSVSLSGTTLTVTPTTGEAKTFTTQDTTYSEASTTSAGLMSAADKRKLDDLGTSKKIIFMTAQAYNALGTNIEKDAIYFIN